MRQNELIHKAIVDIMTELDCDFWDATVEFCENNEIEPEDLIEQMDYVTLERLKASACDQRLVRKEYRDNSSIKLTFY